MTIWNPQKLQILGIYQVYTSHMTICRIWPEYTGYIPGIWKAWNIPGIYQVYSSHILFQEKGIYSGYTRYILSESAISSPGIYLEYFRYIPEMLKSCIPACSFCAIGCSCIQVLDYSARENQRGGFPCTIVHVVHNSAPWPAVHTKKYKYNILCTVFFGWFFICAL